MEITQAATTSLEVRLLHAGRVAKFGAAGGLIFEPRGNVFVLVTRDTFGQDGFLEFLEQFFVPDDQPGFNQGRTRFDAALVILVVRGRDAFGDGTDGVPGFETEIEEREPDSAQDFFQNRQRLRLPRDLAFMQEQQVNVAVGIQFAAAITAERDDSDGRKLLAGLNGKRVYCGDP